MRIPSRVTTKEVEKEVVVFLPMQALCFQPETRAQIKSLRDIIASA